MNSKMTTSRKKWIDLLSQMLECTKAGNREDNDNFLNDGIELVNEKFEWRLVTE